MYPQDTGFSVHKDFQESVTKGHPGALKYTQVSLFKEES